MARLCQSLGPSSGLRLKTPCQNPPALAYSFSSPLTQMHLLPSSFQNRKLFSFPLARMFSSPSPSQNRKFGKVIRYHSRHQQASQRPRVKGQFVKHGPLAPASGATTATTTGAVESSQMDEYGDEEDEDEVSAVPCVHGGQRDKYGRKGLLS